MKNVVSAAQTEESKKLQQKQYGIKVRHAKNNGRSTRGLYINNWRAHHES